MRFQAICFNVVAVSIAKNIQVVIVISKFIMVFGIGSLSQEGAIAVIVTFDHKIYMVIILVILVIPKVNVLVFIANDGHGRFLSPVPIRGLTMSMVCLP